MNPESRFFSGKGLILGGSHSPNLNSNHSLVGDLSAILIQNVSPLINLIRVPSKQIALMDEWEAKIEAIANSTIPVDVTNLSGVPSWMLVLIKRILEKTGKQTLEEVWPNLEVFSTAVWLLPPTANNTDKSFILLKCIMSKLIMHRKAISAHRMTFPTRLCY